MKKHLHSALLRASIVNDLLKTLWKFKLWWSFPIITLLLLIMVSLLVAGHTGVAAFIYPLF